MKFTRLCKMAATVSFLCSTSVNAAPAHLENITEGFGTSNGPVAMDFSDDGKAYCITSGGEIKVFNSDFELENKFGFGYFSGYVGGIKVHNDRVYATSIPQHRLRIFDTDGTYIQSIGGGSDSAHTFKRPAGFDIKDNKLYIADAHNHRIAVWDINTLQPVVGEFFGGSGWDPGQFRYPVDVSIGEDGSIYVANNVAHRVEKFDNNSAFVARFGSNGTQDGQFKYAGNLYVDDNGNIYVTDAEGTNRVQIFDSAFSHMYTLGTVASGSEDGKFNEPRAITSDNLGKVYVPDDRNQRIQVFFWPGAWAKPGTVTLNNEVSGLEDAMTLGDGYHLKLGAGFNINNTTQLNAGSSLTFNKDLTFSSTALNLNGGNLIANADSLVISPITISNNSKIEVAEGKRLRAQGTISGPINKEGPGLFSLTQSLANDISVNKGDIGLENGMNANVTVSPEAGGGVILVGGKAKGSVNLSGGENKFGFDINGSATPLDSELAITNANNSSFALYNANTTQAPLDLANLASMSGGKHTAFKEISLEGIGDIAVNNIPQGFDKPLVKDGLNTVAFNKRLDHSVVIKQGTVELMDGTSKEIKGEGNGDKTLILSKGELSEGVNLGGGKSTFRLNVKDAAIAENVKIDGGSNNGKNTFIFDGKEGEVYEIKGESFGESKPITNFATVELKGGIFKVVDGGFKDKQVGKVILKAGAELQTGESFVGQLLGNYENQELVNEGSYTGSIVLPGGANKITNLNKFKGNVNFGGGDDIMENSGTLEGSLELNGGNDLVINTGKLKGDVVFKSSGNDTLENDGEITGSVTFFGKNNTLKVGPNAKFSKAINVDKSGNNTLSMVGNKREAEKITNVLAQYKGFSNFELGDNRSIALDQDEVSGNFTIKDTATLYLGGKRVVGKVINDSPNSLVTYNKGELDTREPGNSVIEGDYEQSAKGNLVVRIDSATGKVVNGLYVTGDVKLDGKLTIDDLRDGDFVKDNTSYKVLTSGGNITGAFKVTTLAGYLDIISTSYEDGMITINTRIEEPETEDLVGVNNELASLLYKNRNNSMEANRGLVALVKSQHAGVDSELAMKELSPEGHGAFISSSILQTRMFHDQIIWKLKHSSNQDKFWARGYNANSELSDRDGLYGHKQSVGGTVLGFDKKLEGKWDLGVAIGIGQSKVSSKNGTTKGRIDHYQGALYGGFKEGALYTNAILSAQGSSTRTKRSLTIADHKLESEYGSLSLGTRAEAGLRFSVSEGLDLNPFVNIDALHYRSQSIKETGKGLAFDIASKSNTYVQGGLGASVIGKKTLPHYSLIPSLSVSYHRELTNKHGNINTKVGNDNISFKSRGLENDILKLGLGVSGIGLGEKYFNHSMYANYEAQVSSKSVQHNVSIGYKIKF